MIDINQYENNKAKSRQFQITKIIHPSQFRKERDYMSVQQENCSDNQQKDSSDNKDKIAHSNDITRYPAVMKKDIYLEGQQSFQGDDNSFRQNHALSRCPSLKSRDLSKIQKKNYQEEGDLCTSQARLKIYGKENSHFHAISEKPSESIQCMVQELQLSKSQRKREEELEQRNRIAVEKYYKLYKEQSLSMNIEPRPKKKLHMDQQ